MKKNLILIFFNFLFFTIFSQNIIGTYKIRGQNSSYNKKCRQLTLFADSTYENITCGEIIFPYKNSWTTDSDTVYFTGSILGLPTGNSKFIFKNNKLYRVNKETETLNYWIFKRKNKRPQLYQR